MNNGQKPYPKIHLRINRALFWLQEYNLSYSNFHSNYDTLNRFDPEKLMHKHKASEFDANYHTIVDTNLQDEPTVIVTNRPFSNSKVTWIYEVESETNDVIVPYNHDILYLWGGGAHMNIQKVTESGWEMYPAKYVAKGEPAFKLNTSKDASEPEKYLRTRVVGRQIRSRSHQSWFLSVLFKQGWDLSDNRSKPSIFFLKRNEHLPADPKSENVFYSIIQRKYMERPTELQDVLYMDWAEKYLLARAGCESCKPGATKRHSARIYTDIPGRKWKTCRTEAIARWKLYMLIGDKQAEIGPKCATSQEYTNAIE